MVQLQTKIHSWLFDDALPFWSTNGIDRNAGGYIERFDAADMRPFADVKRVRVIGRQMYVFSHAAILGFEGGVKHARWGLDFLKKHAWLGGGCGWARTLNRDGTVRDSTPDLYDQAFVLFALAWYYRASGDEEAIVLANRTLDSIESGYRANKGFWHETPPSGYRQQNPHMHMLEAALALYEAFPDKRYGDLAHEMVGLFQMYFFDAGKGTLTEFFDDDWRPASGMDGRITEPGHQFEWAWILANAQRLLGLDLVKEIRGLIEFAETYGVDPKTGITYQQVRDDGKPIDAGSRTWPNTERLKSAVALYYLDAKDPYDVFNQSARVLFERHLSGPCRGTWVEKFDSEGRPISDIVPASTFYHIFLAFTEALQVLEKLRQDNINTSSSS